ncbi:hypothetical protein H1P_190055 [Hyella patelloides LEGE 07179]|uniref:Uncharacterized protein n=1 Tax=Hyella patelloides LEGE 07179 TaxID=945734 RepID=A0A563VP79_9CYAN|nr:hypothetical protein H1P_190055 [Hyella patelloides LEGE 07179]
MYRLRHSSEKVALAMKMRAEGNGLRATGRILGKSHATIIGWEKHLEKIESKWSPAAPGTGQLRCVERHIIVQLDVNVVLIEEDKIYMLKRFKD